MDIELWKERKKQLKLTFEDLSISTGLSVRTLKSLFSGERTNTTTFTVQAIEKALGLDNSQIPANLSPKKQQVVDLIMQLDESKADEIVSIINYVLSKDK